MTALAAGLKKHGHHVQLVAGDEFYSLVKDAGVEFSPLGINIQSAMNQEKDMFTLMERIKPNILNVLPKGTHAIVSTFMGVSTCSIARTRQIPFFYFVPFPSLATSQHPHPFFPPLPFGKAFNRWTYSITDGRVIKACPDASSLFLEPRPTYLFPFSPSVYTKPLDWGGYTHVTGFWFLKRRGNWKPSRELMAFMDAGPKPIYVGFSSMQPKDPIHMTSVILQALEQTGQRAVMVSGWGGLISSNLPTSVFLAESVPFDWLFPKIQAAIHHGGLGTTAAALSAGIPSVTIPFGLDQPFWARTLHQLGVAGKPLDPNRLTTALLVDTIGSVLNDQTMLQKAAQLGDRIRSEDGVETAVHIIETVAEGKQV
jgi:UDP:flavonoid glycosyltransferase YjiC (YdhE family)